MDGESRAAALLRVIDALARGGTADAICQALVQGLVGAGADRCEVFLGSVYQEDALAEATCVAAAGTGDAAIKTGVRAPNAVASLRKKSNA